MTEPTPFPFEDPNVDADALDQALSSLPAEPMPEGVWASLQAAIARESQARESTASRGSNRGRWLLLGAAAAAVVVVGGVWLGSQNNAPQPIVAADEAAQGASETPVTAGLLGSNGTSSNGTGSSDGTRSVGGNGGAVVQTASFPARKVVATQTNYATDSMPTQVGALLSTAGVRNIGDIEKALPATATPEPVGTDGFTATMEGLRSCVTAITKNAAAQALIIDRALFEGNDAGIVVLPAGSGGPDSPNPTMTADSSAGPLDVWVVEPDCAVMDPHVMMHMLHQMVSGAGESSAPSASADDAMGQPADSSPSP